MTSENTILPTERHNAMISYCFLAFFMLISRDERFSNHFVRAHSRYAVLIHVGFLLLISTLIYSRNFDSIIIFEISWVHILIFIWFFLLLGVLGIGIYRAMIGEEPHFSLQGITFSELKWIGNEVVIDEKQKVPLLLSHIPFLGLYLSEKYGNFLSGGTKFGNWSFVLASVFLWLDPSMTLFIVWLCFVTFWIVYQAVLVSSGDNIRLIGHRFPSSRDVHVILRSVWKYTQAMLKHGNILPDWRQMRQIEEENYEKNIMINTNMKLNFPIFNLVEILYLIKKWEVKQNEIQSIIISMVCIYALFMWHTPLLMLVALSTFWLYYQTKGKKDTSLPLVGEIAEIIEKIIEWRKTKSTPQEVTFHQNNT